MHAASKPRLPAPRQGAERTRGPERLAETGHGRPADPVTERRFLLRFTNLGSKMRKTVQGNEPCTRGDISSSPARRKRAVSSGSQAAASHRRRMKRALNWRLVIESKGLLSEACAHSAAFACSSAQAGVRSSGGAGLPSGGSGSTFGFGLPDLPDSHCARLSR